MRCWLVLVALTSTAVAGSAPDLALARGKALLDGGDNSAAVLVFDELVDMFPTSSRAPEAAMLAIAALDRDSRFDEMLAHVERFVHDRPLMRDRVFARDLRRLYMRCCFRRDVAPPPADFEREALTRLDEFAAAPGGPDSDELLFGAGWQFCVSHHADAAERAWRVLLALFPDSELASRARIGLGDLVTCTNVRTGAGTGI